MQISQKILCWNWREKQGDRDNAVQDLVYRVVCVPTLSVVSAAELASGLI